MKDYRSKFDYLAVFKGLNKYLHEIGFQNRQKLN